MNAKSNPESNERIFAVMRDNGWTYLTDWTFTSIFPLETFLKEANYLKRYYGKNYNKFTLTFGDHRGHLDLWGKLEEDFTI